MPGGGKGAHLYLHFIHLDVPMVSWFLRVFLSPWYLIFCLSIYSEVKHFHTKPLRFLLSRSTGCRGFLPRSLPLMLVKINQAAIPLGPSVRVFTTAMWVLSHRKKVEIKRQTELMLTGTWLERLKLVAGLRFLPAVVPTLLLALLAEFFRFLLFVVVCRAGSALARPAKRNRGNAKNIMHTDGDRVSGCLLTARCAVFVRVPQRQLRQTDNVKYGVQTKLCTISINACKENTHRDKHGAFAYVIETKATSQQPSMLCFFQR